LRYTNKQSGSKDRAGQGDTYIYWYVPCVRKVNREKRTHRGLQLKVVITQCFDKVNSSSLFF
jgi:hypothetical protein